MPPEEDGPEVLIAGAGPAGLTLAHELARRRVRVRVIDRAAGPATTSRALAVHPRTLEACHQMGLADALVARGRPVVHFTVHARGRELIRFDTNYARLPTAYPFTLMLDQVLTEEILRERLAALGVGIEWGVELSDCAPAGSRVHAELRRAGRREQVTADWLVGADGSRSTVRERLGLRLVGEATRTWLNADVVVDTGLPRDSNHLVHTGSGTVLLVPFPGPAKWRAVDTGYAGQGADPETVRHRLAGSLARGLGYPVAVSEPTWVSVFRVQQRMITAMRSGRCFVAGDAAHVHSPASGQGMNTGMQDACNLAWKLADVVRGHAREELLDTYAAERVPVGGRLLSTTRTATALVALRHAMAPVAMPVGLSLLKAVRPLKQRVEHRIMAGMSGLALHYADSPLTYGTAAGAAGVRPGHLVACTEADAARHPGHRALREALTDPRWLLLLFAGEGGAELAPGYGRAVQVCAVVSRDSADGPALADPDGALRQSLGVPPGGWALIRPDGYLAAKGRRSGSAALAARLQAFHLLPAGPAPGAGA